MICDQNIRAARFAAGLADIDCGTGRHLVLDVEPTGRTILGLPLLRPTSAVRIVGAPSVPDGDDALVIWPFEGRALRRR